MRTKVGIDDIAVYIPRLYVELADENRPEKPTEFSMARKSDPSKYLHGIGIAKMSVPDTYQDSAVLAANAIFELMERNNVQPSSLARKNFLIIFSAALKINIESKSVEKNYEKFLLNPSRKTSS